MGRTDTLSPGAFSMTEHHDHTENEERRIREAALDETLDGTFPASDPPSSLPNPDEHDAQDRGGDGGDEEN